jgi:hypothetical protein
LQMTKLAIIPFTVLLETLFLKKQFRLLQSCIFLYKYQIRYQYTACIALMLYDFSPSTLLYSLLIAARR